MRVRALFYPLRAYDDEFGRWLRRVTDKLGFSPAEVVILGYENVGGAQYALIEQPHVENSIVGIMCKQRGLPLPPPERKRVPVCTLDVIGGEA